MLEQKEKDAKERLIKALKKYSGKHRLPITDVQIYFTLIQMEIPAEVRQQMGIPDDQEAMMGVAQFNMVKMWKEEEPIDIYHLMGVPHLPFTGAPVSKMEGALVQGIIGNALIAFSAENEIDPLKIKFVVISNKNDDEEIKICMYDDKKFIKYIGLDEIVNERFVMGAA